MAQKEKVRAVIGNGFFSRARISGKPQKSTVVLVIFLLLASGLHAQIEFPAGDFWSLDAGVGMSGLLVEGTSFQFLLDPKLWLSPPLMVGSKLGVNYSIENEDKSAISEANSDILTFEGQVYLRWNFLRLGSNVNKRVNVFAQAGLGMVASYRGDANPLDDVTETRGSLLFDGALGVTIPLSERWHIEPQVRGGYPHIFGVSLTAGYKFPLPEKTKYIETTKIEYREVIRTLPPSEIIKRIRISSVEFILFGPDIGKYNLGIDHDAQSLNELVLDETAKFLKENPDYRARIEGHANPVTADSREADELMALSTIRANTVADQLKARGITDEQLVVIAFGGTRTVTSDRGIWERNRRVELIIIQIDANAN